MPKGRILVVDDLPDWRKTLSGILLDEGYEVRSAGSRPEALQLLEAERFHLAVLDVRLDEADEDNREGLELMRQIKAQDPTMLIVILTGYADVGMVQEALRPQSNGLPLAYSFVEKPNTQELIEFIQRAFEREIEINWDLVIHTDQNFTQKIAARLRFADQPKPPLDQLQAEIDELLRKLFFTCAEITLYPLERGFSRAAVFQVEPHYHGRGQGEIMVVKIGEWPLIQQEEHNFAQTVQGIVGGHRLPQRLELARTRSLGGLVYSFAGLGEVKGFSEFYQEATTPQIASVLGNLFLETCFPWGRRSGIYQPSFNFAEHYFSHLHLSPAELRRALATLCDKQSYLSQRKRAGSELKFLETIPLIDPVEFVIGHPLVADAYLTLTHGDLIGYNVILDHHQETWLIDFAKTGQGLSLQDFASFENFIKFSLLESSALDSVENLRLFYEWEKELVNSPTLQPPARLLELALPNSFLKAHQVVLTVRRLAHQVSSHPGGGEHYWQEYLIDLLFHALKLITIKGLQPLQQTLALVSAALICQRLLADS